jgi:hypothetical protein
MRKLTKQLYLRGSIIFVQFLVGLAVVLDLVFKLVGITEPKVVIVTLLIAIGFAIVHLLAALRVQ